MEKLYVNEIRPGGEISTVGLFYSRAEAERIVAQLKAISEKTDCRYEIVEAAGGSPSTNPPKAAPVKKERGMPYIRTIPPAEAGGTLKEVYESGSGPSSARGRVSMIRQVQSLNPDNLAAWRALGVGIMRGESRITRRQREMIATLVSATNRCSY